jgi:hypothetical protein
MHQDTSDHAGTSVPTHVALKDNQMQTKQLCLIKSSQATSHVKWLKFSISWTISVPVLRVMIYLYPEHPTYTHAGAHVRAKCEPMA